MDKVQFLNDRELPFAKVLGLKYVAASETGVKAEMVVRPELCTRPDILPESYTTELAALRDDVRPFPFAEAEAILTEEYGRPPGEVFTV